MLIALPYLTASQARSERPRCGEPERFPDPRSYSGAMSGVGDGFAEMGQTAAVTPA
jgi:hypothetical protein